MKNTSYTILGFSLGVLIILLISFLLFTFSYWAITFIAANIFNIIIPFS